MRIFEMVKLTPLLPYILNQSASNETLSLYIAPRPLVAHALSLKRTIGASFSAMTTRSGANRFVGWIQERLSVPRVSFSMKHSENMTIPDLNVLPKEFVSWHQMNRCENFGETDESFIDCASYMPVTCI